MWRRRPWGPLPLLLLAVLAFSGCGGDGGDDTSSSQQAKRPAAGDKRGAALERDFARADADRDGAIDKAERSRQIRSDFRDMDLDRNGVVTIEDVALEARRSGPPGAERDPGELSDHLPFDGNRDGRITAAEYEAYVLRRVAGPLDRDGDGRTTLEEAKRRRLPPSEPKRQGAWVFPLLLAAAGLRRRWVVPGLAVLAALTIAAPAGASAIYNQSDQFGKPISVGVYFECGVFCSNFWRIQPGKFAARPGKGGSFQAWDWPLDQDTPGCEFTEHPDLQSHGWVQFIYESGQSVPPGRGLTKYDWELYGNTGNKVGTYQIGLEPDACN